MLGWDWVRYCRSHSVNATPAGPTRLAWTPHNLPGLSHHRALWQLVKWEFLYIPFRKTVYKLPHIIAGWAMPITLNNPDANDCCKPWIHDGLRALVAIIAQLVSGGSPQRIYV
jgi:hypothetical protein